MLISRATPVAGLIRALALHFPRSAIFRHADGYPADFLTLPPFSKYFSVIYQYLLVILFATYSAIDLLLTLFHRIGRLSSLKS